MKRQRVKGSLGARRLDKLAYARVYLHKEVAALLMAVAGVWAAAAAAVCSDGCVIPASVTRFCNEIGARRLAAAAEVVSV